MGMIKPIIVGWKRITEILSALYVRSNAAVERIVYDSDGNLYHGGTKITATAAQLNGTAPVLTDARLNYSIGTHNYGGAAVDWTISAEELLKTVHKPTNANGAVNAIIAVTAGIPYIFINATGQALTVKTPAGTGISIANGKAQQVMSDGTNVIAIAAVTA